MVTHTSPGVLFYANKLLSVIMVLTIINIQVSCGLTGSVLIKCGFHRVNGIQSLMKVTFGLITSTSQIIGSSCFDIIK